jgi:hypothetical protein
MKKERCVKKIPLACLILLFCGTGASATVLHRGDAVVTHSGGVDVVRLSDPLCTGGRIGGNWAMPNLQLLTSADLGGDAVFGVALRLNLDTAATDIFLTASSGWGSQYGATQRVYKVDGQSGQPVVWADLGMMSGPGLGQIVHNEDDDVFYVSNFADGRVYVLGVDPATGAAVNLGTYDPRFPSSSFPQGMAPLGERVFGLGYNASERRLYYSLWTTDHSVPRKGSANYVFSIPIYADGLLPLTDQPVGWPPELVAWPEFQVPNNPGSGFSSPISDIDFDEDNGLMYLGARPMMGDHDLGPGHARVDLYLGEHRGWTRDAGGFWVGGNGLEACGGVTLDWAVSDSCNDGPHLMVTSCGATSGAAIQTLPTEGGSYEDGFITAFPGITVGDLEVCPWCPERQQIEIECGDGLDNDFDNLPDCLDPDCGTDGFCTLESAALSTVRVEDMGCAYTHGYWSEHHRFAARRNMIPWPIDEETTLCGETWLTHVGRIAADQLNIVAQQWVAATLNVALGAHADWLITWALLAAEDAMVDCVIDDQEAGLALQAKNILDNFNNGLLGPVSCEEPHGMAISR